MKAIHLEYACVNIDIDGTFFLVDPFISPNPLVKHIGINSVKVDYILITHAHVDHIAGIEAIVKRTSTRLITNLEILVHFEALGLSGHSMNLDGSRRFVDGKVKIKTTKAEHFSLFPDDSHGDNPAGFLVDYNDETTHIAGDTVLHYDMKITPHQHKVNLGTFLIGNNYAMGVRDALTTICFVQVDNILGVHYDTFSVIKINKELSKQKLKDDYCRPYLIEIGATLDFEDFNICTL